MKEPMEHSAFPSDETLAAFIDGRLDEETRTRVVAHVADCEDCYGTVMASGTWQRESEPHQASTVPLAPRRNRHLIALAAAAAIGGVLLYPPLVAQWHIAQLRRAANEMPTRASDARLSLDLSFQEFRRFRGGASEDSQDLALLAAAAQVQADSRRKGGERHSLGIALLVTGKRDAAAEALGEAVVAEAGVPDLGTAISRCTDVALLNDLSAANGAVTDFHVDETAGRIALVAAKRAWQLDPKSPITAWNRAVATERSEPKDAAAAWRDYLAIDATSAWSVEAKNRLKFLAQSMRDVVR